MLVENLSVPFDRRVWMEATTLREAGYDVTVICPAGKERAGHTRIDGISIYRYPVPSAHGLPGHLVEYLVAIPATFLLSLLVFIHKGFDVIHTANPPDFFFPIGRFYQLFGKRFIFDHHDLVPESCATRWGGLKGTLLRGFASWAERETFRAADVVISTNQSYRQIAIERGGVAPERVFVVRSGPRADRFVPVTARDALRRGRRHLVAYLGVMGPNDGLDHLLDAIRHVTQTRCRSDVGFVLIGDGDMRPVLIERATRMGITPFVEFTGRIPDSLVIEYVSTADLGVAPDPLDALNDISTMNKIVEYMALGRPVVAYDLREARVSAGEAAVYAKPNDPAALGDAILDLLDSHEQRARMGSLARQRFLSGLTWENQRGTLLAAYEQVFQSRDCRVRGTS
jgi:glycosyltransferase involved in cell wall biosynthesis